jgi:hypothetical protein
MRHRQRYQVHALFGQFHISGMEQVDGGDDGSRGVRPAEVSVRMVNGRPTVMGHGWGDSGPSGLPLVVTAARRIVWDVVGVA